MYADAKINARCKLKAGLAPDTWKYVALPWTIGGKDARELPGSLGFTKLAEGALKDGVKDPFAATATKPATTTTSGGTGTVVTGGSAQTTTTSWSQPRVGVTDIRNRVRFVTDSIPGREIYDTVTGSPGTMGLLAVAGLSVAAFLLMNKKRATATVGYSRRRRSRR
jgi:hypothetical protein